MTDEQSPRVAGRVRRPHHWDRDLQEGRSSECLVAAALAAEPSVTAVTDHSMTLDAVDFTVAVPELTFGVEVKSKRRRYSAAATAAPQVPEPRQLIIDEAHLRRAFSEAGVFVVVVHDLPNERWHLFSCWTLLLCEKHRWQRPLRRTTDCVKGKVTIDMGDADRTIPLVSGHEIVALARRTAGATDRIEAWRG